MENLKDLIIDFIEDHKVLVIIGSVAVGLLVIGLIIRGVNMSKAQKAADEYARQQALVQNTQTEVVVEEPKESAPPKSQYQVNLGLSAEKDGRVEYQEAEPTPTPEQTEVKRSSFDISVRIYDKTGVPEVNVDGSKFSDYLSGISLADFGVLWGDALTEDDYNTKTRYLVGVEQDRNDFERGDLQSVGWVFDNIDKMNDSDAIKFTNLHVISSLDDSHVAVLCSYDWYSVFGMKDTLVLFEDKSGTLKTEDFVDGAVFSATVFKHNMKVETVNEQRVLCIEYNTFKEG